MTKEAVLGSPFTHPFLFCSQGDIGPFNASLPTEVPLWVAIFLKQRRKCRIQPPDWMDVGKVTNNFLKNEECDNLLQLTVRISVITSCHICILFLFFLILFYFPS